MVRLGVASRGVARAFGGHSRLPPAALILRFSSARRLRTKIDSRDCRESQTDETVPNRLRRSTTNDWNSKLKGIPPMNLVECLLPGELRRLIGLVCLTLLLGMWLFSGVSEKSSPERGKRADDSPARSFIVLGNIFFKHNGLPDDVLSETGEPTLSWRAVLTQEYRDELVDQVDAVVDLTKAWDDRANLPALKRRPVVFSCPNGRAKGKEDKTKTRVLRVKEVHEKLVEGAPIPDDCPYLVLVDSKYAVPWTKPKTFPREILLTEPSVFFLTII